MTNREVKRRCDRAYYHRHKVELKEKQREWYRRTFQELDNQMNKVFGKLCIICGKSENLEVHEIHGEEHKHSGSIWMRKFYLKHPEDFVRVCKPCHRTVHYLGSLTPKERHRLFELLLLSSSHSFVISEKTGAKIIKEITSQTK
jgi:hypothetical protein